MTLNGGLSLAVLQGVGPSPVGLYQLSVSGRWLPLHTPDVAALWHSTAGKRLLRGRRREPITLIRDKVETGIQDMGI